MISLRVSTSNSASRSLDAFRASLIDTIAGAVEEVRDTVVVKAVTDHMREFKPHEVINPSSKTLNSPLIRRFEPRNPTPVLRRLTGRLTHSLLGDRQGVISFAFVSAVGRNENIHEMSIGFGAVRLRYGSRVPYAAIHEYGGVIPRGGVTITIGARPYMRPAIEGVRPVAPLIVEQRIIELASRLGLN